MLRAKISGGSKAAGFVIDQWSEITDLSGISGEGGGTASHHLAIFHAAHDIGQIGDFFVDIAFRPNLITGSHDDKYIGIGFGEGGRGIFHVIRVKDDKFGALGNQFFSELIGGGAGAIGGIYLIEVNHLGTKFFFEIETCLIMSLAPAIVIIGADHQ